LDIPSDHQITNQFLKKTIETISIQYYSWFSPFPYFFEKKDKNLEYNINTIEIYFITLG